MWETYSRRTALGMSFITAPSNYGDYLIQLKEGCKPPRPESSVSCARTFSVKMPVMTIEFGQRIADLLGDPCSTPQTHRSENIR